MPSLIGFRFDRQGSSVFLRGNFHDPVVTFAPVEKRDVRTVLEDLEEVVEGGG